jgi:hypothetical protein
MARDRRLLVGAVREPPPSPSADGLGDDYRCVKYRIFIVYAKPFACQAIFSARTNIQAVRPWAKPCSLYDTQLAIGVAAALTEDIVASFAGDREEAHARAWQIFSSLAREKKIDSDNTTCANTGYTLN